MQWLIVIHWTTQLCKCAATLSNGRIHHQSEDSLDVLSLLTQQTLLCPANRSSCYSNRANNEVLLNTPTTQITETGTERQTSLKGRGVQLSSSSLALSRLEWIDVTSCSVGRPSAVQWSDTELSELQSACRRSAEHQSVCRKSAKQLTVEQLQSLSCELVN